MRWRRARRAVVAATLLLVALLSAGVLGATSMMRHSPAWWRQIHTEDPRTLASARHVEDGLTQVLHAERPPASLDEATGRWMSADWAFSIRAADANAWLNTRLPAWLTRAEDLSAWPEEVRQVQVDFRGGRVLLGVELAAGQVVRVLSAEVRPEIRADGSLWLPAETVRIGTLPLPAGLVLGGARRREADFVPVSIRRTGESDLFWRALLGEASVAQSPTIRLPDGRRVRIVGLRAQGGVLEVRCRTEWGSSVQPVSGAGEEGSAPAWGDGIGLHPLGQPQADEPDRAHDAP